MSGIAALVNSDGSPVPSSDIERVANVLKPHGPDRQRTLVRRNVAFASCLYRLTPEDTFENQPLLFANRYVFVFDGRIDNRSELHEMLGLAATQEPPMPDSAIALGLFRRWGEDSFINIVGAFGLIVMDLNEQTLVCARDPLGLRPLHYHWSGKQFVVATSPEALFALSWVPRVLNKDKIADGLVQRGLNAETTYYRQIFRVPPGSVVRIKNGSLSKQCFWNPVNIPKLRFRDEGEYVDLFRQTFQNAVNSNLRSRTVPCATITGGLDSSSIAVVAAATLRNNQEKLNTFTAVPEKGFSRNETRALYFDETQYVKTIADMHPNIVSHFVRPSPRPLLDQVSDLIRKGGTPPGDVFNDLWFMDILAAARSAGHRVMLSGEMGNHVISYSGWPRLPKLLLTGRWYRLASELSAFGFRWKYLLRHRTLAPMIPPGIFRFYKSFRRNFKPPWLDYSAINGDFANTSGVVSRAAKEFLPFDGPPPLNSKISRIHAFNSYSETADWFAQIRANWGIDVRTPAFDRRLVEFCIGVPDDQYLCDGYDRWLIRRSMRGKLPDTVLYNRKTGVQAADWFQRLTRERDGLKKEVRRLAENSELTSMIDLPRLEEILNHWPKLEPACYSSGAAPLRMALPQALGAAFFIESVAGFNSDR